jgi:hypothetical protein
MKGLVLAVLLSITLSVPGWAADSTSHEQAKANAAAHRNEARNNQERYHHHHKHHKHHRHHAGA